MIEIIISDVNPTETIYSGEVILKRDNEELVVNGDIISQFIYSHDLRLKGNVEKFDFGMLFDILGSYSLKAGELEGQIHIHKSSGSEVIGTIERELASPETKIDELNVKLINLIDIGSGVVKKNDHYGGLSKINIDDWILEIAKNTNYRDVYKSLNEYGGYAETHVVKITKNDGSDFVYQNVLKTLERFYEYMMFLTGRRIYTNQITGKKDNHIKYLRYEARSTSQWKNLNTWYPKNRKEIYNDLFNGFSEFWDSSVWGKYKNIILGTFVECFSDVTLENRITSIQIALEIIARTYLVEEKNILSSTKFKNMSIIESIKLICESLEINLREPTGYVYDMTNITNDPVEFLVKVRNSIVHPKVKIELTFINLKTAYYVGLWTLELCMLRLFNYNGRYMNRLSRNKWHSDSETGGCYYLVPWFGLV